MKNTLRNTKTLVLASIVLSCLSYVTTQWGWSEIYPFYFWKLYSQPAAWSQQYTSYRIYAKNNQNTNWTRLANEDRATFNRDEVLYFLNPITQRLITNPTEKDKQKLKIFCQYIAPQYTDYKIVEEKYKPLELLKNETKFDTTTVWHVE